MINKLSTIRITIYTFTSTFAVLYAPIIFLFYESKGINMAQIGILFAIGSIINLITEIPFGMFSDNYSRKISVILGSLFTISGLLIYINGFGFTQMAIAIGLISIGMSGKSGSVEALLVKTIKNQDVYFHINNYTTYIANSLSAIVVGFLFSINSNYPFYISLACEVLLLILILTVKDKKEVLKSRLSPESKMNFKNIYNLLHKYRYIFFVLFISYFFIPQISVFFPNYLDIQEVPVELFGVIYFVMNIIPIIGTFIYKKKLSEKNIEHIVLISFIVFSIGMVTMGILKNIYIGLITYALLRIVIGWFWLVFSIYFNKISNDSNKATVFSVKGMVMNIAFIVSDPFIGLVIYKSSIYNTYLITGIFTTIIVALLISRLRLYKKTKRREENAV